MKKIYIALSMLLVGTQSPVFAADVGVSINIGQPGFYGRIDIGDMPQPRLIVPRPVVIERVPVGVVREPLYLRVPPGHQRNWRRYCSRYDACGHPVYFVDHRWYNDVYVPHYREHHKGGRDEYRESHHDRDDDRGHDDHDHGRGHGKGKDHDRH